MKKHKLWTVVTWRAMFLMIQKIEVNGKIVGVWKESFKPGSDRFTSKEKHEIFEKLYDVMIKKGIFNEYHKPKSPMAIYNQLAWMHVISNKSVDGNFSKIQNLRLIAYGTGFISMHDILWLEQNLH